MGQPFWQAYPDLEQVAPSVSRKQSTRAPWPDPMADPAYHGLFGEIVRTIEPHTEADNAAILFQALTAFGSCLGRGPHYQVEGDEHHGNMFVVLVGQSGKGRKGTSWGRVRQIFEKADPEWARQCVHSGLSSGEGVIWSVRDPILERDAKDPSAPDVVKDPGVPDKRLMVVESEFGNVLRVMERQGNTLSRVVRDAWDRGALASLTKNSPARASGAHVSIVGHITDDELRRHLSQTDMANGFANRFTFVCTRRSKVLPFGGALEEATVEALGQKAGLALVRARSICQVAMDEAASKGWIQAYPALSEGHPGLFGAVIGRAEAQVVRLALLYALGDGCSEISLAHLRAALAAWEYAEASAQCVFGITMGDPVADDILVELTRAGHEGLTRSAIHSAFSRNRSASQIDRALDLLRSANRAVFETSPTGGRPSQTWRVASQGAQ